MFKLERLTSGTYVLRWDNEFIEDSLHPSELLKTLAYIARYGFGSGIPFEHTPYHGRLTDSTLLLESG